MTTRKPSGWRKIVQAGGPMPFLKKVITKMDAQEIAKYEKLRKDYIALEKETGEAWRKGHAYADKIDYHKKVKITYTNYKLGGVTQRKLKSIKIDVPLTQQKKLKELYKAAEMTARRAVRAYDRYDEFYKKMTNKYK